MTSVNEDIDFANHFNSLNDDTNQQKVKFNKDDKIYETLEKSKKNTVGTHESRNTNAEVPFASSRERKSLKPCTRKTEESGKSMNDGTKQRKLMSSEDMQHNSLRMKILSPEQVQFDRPEMELHVKILTIILMSAASIALMAMFVTVTCILYKNSSRHTTLIIQD